MVHILKKPMVDGRSKQFIDKQRRQNGENTMDLCKEFLKSTYREEFQDVAVGASWRH